jgi:ElaB/YqjD/DUF883 family membrane-anchored ribosome-binding protein
MTVTTDLDTFADETNRSAQSRLQQSASKLKDTAGMVQARAGEFADEARAFADRTASQLGAFSKTAVEQAKQRPATSALVILGVGIAAGAILAMCLRGPAESALDGATRFRRRLNA